MRRSDRSLLVLLVSLAAACGSGSANSGAPDVPTDAVVALPDAAPDRIAPADTPGAGADVPDPDAAVVLPDAPTDTPTAPEDAPVAPTDTPTATEDVPVAPDDLAGPPEDAPAPPADTPAPDGPAPTVFAAVPGATCDLDERIGLVTVSTNDGDPSSRWAAATLSDRPSPFVSPVALETATCRLYEEPPPADCGTCAAGTLCAADGICRAVPLPVDELVLTLRSGAAAQVFAEAMYAGTVGGEVTLPDAPLAVEVAWSGWTVTLDATAMPGVLAGVTGILAGSYEAPEGLDVTWSPAEGGGVVTTHVPMNHHVGEATFTECAVDAAVGALHVDGAMLAPLAVATGLEFQGIVHARRAAARTPAGCVELRFLVDHYVNLF